MSWFDTSSFSSFAKTAFNQAQNLQKSIDKVLDIPDETGEKSSASSKQKSTPSSLSEGAENESTKKSSLTTSTASKSNKKTSSDLKKSKDSSKEESSFWSSFLGDSLSSEDSKTESKTSSRRTGVKKLGVRVGGGNTGSSDSKNDPDRLANTSKENENISSTRSRKQDKKCDINLIDSAKSESNLKASQTKTATNGTNLGLSNQNENVTDSAISKVVEDASPEKAECGIQQLSVAPVDRHEDKDKSLKLSDSSGKSLRGKKEVITLGNEAFQGQIDACMQDNSAVNSEGETKATAPNKEPGSLLEEESSHKSDTVHSFQKGELRQSQHTAENTLDTSQSHNLSSQNSGVSCAPVGSSVIDPTHNAVISGKTGHHIQQEQDEQNKFLDVQPLASSTPNRCVKEQDKPAKITHSQPTDEKNKGSNQNELESPITGIKNTISENVAEVFMEAVSFIEDKQSPQNKLKQEIKEPASIDSDVENVVNKLTVQQTNVTIFDTTVKKETNLMENDANYTESSEDLKTKIEELQNEIANLRHVIEVRENKLVEVSKENVGLQETSAILRSQLKQAEAALRAEDEGIEDVRQEFTVRVAATEKKFQVAAKERDQLKVLLEETEQSLNSRNDRQSEEFTTLLKEKDDQIAQLLEEGEKLSKQQLQSNNIIKKLRNKEKENDAVIKKNSKLLEDATSENKKLAEILQVKEETERKQTDAITQLNAYVEKQGAQINKVTSELDDSTEKIRSMQTALDNAYKQLADLHKENASKDSAVQEAALSAEMTAKEGLRVAMEKKERQFQNEIEALEFQIGDLQSGLRRTEQQASRREDNLRQEISDLQQRLQEAEARNQELTESVTYATRPLLRQIENLQSSYGNHTQTWERVERNLTERLNEAQIQLVEAQEKERVATEHALEFKSRVTAVESQLATYLQDKSRLQATLEVERAKLQTAEEATSREVARYETLEVKYRKMMEDNNVEKALLEQQLAVERGKMETEKKKFQHAMDEKERSLLRQSSQSGSLSPSTAAKDEFLKDEVPEASPHRTLGRQSSGTSLIDGISRGIMGAGTAMIERLQAQVKQKDGEIVLLQEEISSLQKTRDAVTEELTVLTSRLEGLELDSRLLADLQTRHKDLEQRHNAVLQMYGEKAEQAEELRMDLEDVKSMYKSQIQELLGASR